MSSERNDNLNSKLDELLETVDKRTATKLEIEKSKRLLKNSSSFLPECQECAQHFKDFEGHINDLHDKVRLLTEDDLINHQQKIRTMSSHLQKQHKLVTSGHYLGIYMSIGMSLGVVFGLLLFDNIALGIPFGLSIGLAIGAGLDEDAKKKGKTL